MKSPWHVFSSPNISTIKKKSKQGWTTPPIQRLKHTSSKISSNPNWWFWPSDFASPYHHYPCHHLVQCFLFKMHIVKQKNSNNNTCGQEIFSSKKQPRKTCSSKLGILGRIKTKNDPTDRRRRRPHTKPRFYSYVPFDDSVFLIRTTKKQQKKKFLFSVLFILKKREKNLKEKKS